MRAARIFAYNLVDGAVPNGLSLYILGAGLMAAGLGQALTAFGSRSPLTPRSSWRFS